LFTLENLFPKPSGCIKISFCYTVQGMKVVGRIANQLKASL